MDFFKKVKKWLSKKTPAQRQQVMQDLVVQPGSRNSSVGGSYESRKSSIYSEPDASSSSARKEIEEFGDFGNKRKSITVVGEREDIPVTKFNVKVKGRGSGVVSEKKMTTNSLGERRPVPAKIQQIVNESKKTTKKKKS